MSTQLANALDAVTAEKKRAAEEVGALKEKNKVLDQKVAAAQNEIETLTSEVDSLKSQVGWLAHCCSTGWIPGSCCRQCSVKWPTNWSTGPAAA
jgi:FtsZ-binding cell division protein ZapB